MSYLYQTIQKEIFLMMENLNTKHTLTLFDYGQESKEGRQEIQAKGEKGG